MKQNPKIKNFDPTWPFELSRGLACGGTRPNSWWRVTNIISHFEKWSDYDFTTDTYYIPEIYEIITSKCTYCYHSVYIRGCKLIFAKLKTSGLNISRLPRHQIWHKFMK